MNIVSVHFKILRCLHHKKYTIADLSFILGIAEFKIRKYIKDLESILDVRGNNELHNFIRKFPEKIDELKKLQNFLPDERKSYIALKFIHNNLLSLSKLSSELNVSRRTLVNDLSDLKILFKQFNLEIESIAFQGIQLKGKESNKRVIFEIFILKNISSIKYIPYKLSEILEFIISLIELEEIANAIKNITRDVECSPTGMGFYHLQLLFCVSLMRINNHDDSLDIMSEVFPEIDDILAPFLYLTNYEKKMIMEYLMNKNFSKILENEENLIKRLKNIVEIINKEFNSNIKFDLKIIMRLYGIVKCYEFKKMIDFKEFYLFNKNLNKNELKKFEKLKKILQSYFPGIDSYELIFMISIFIVEINKDVNTRLEKLKNIIIVYRYLNPINLKELCYNLEIYDLITEETFIHINNLKEYLKNNKVEHIIIFEDLEIPNNSIVSRILLPITQGDRLKLRNIVKKEGTIPNLV